MESPVAPYDIAMIAVLLLCTVMGAWKGMAWQIAAVASLVVSGMLAARFGEQLAPYLWGKPPWNWCLAMLVIYLVTSAAIWLIFRMVAQAIDRVKLKEFDHQVGGLFGAAKGVLWCLVITFFTVTLSETARGWVLDSQSGYYASLMLQRATPVLPPEVRDALGKYIEEFERKLERDEPAETPAETPAFDPASTGRNSHGNLQSAAEAIAWGSCREASEPKAGESRKTLVL